MRYALIMTTFADTIFRVIGNTHYRSLVFNKGILLHIVFIQNHNIHQKCIVEKTIKTDYYHTHYKRVIDHSCIFSNN